MTPSISYRIDSLIQAMCDIVLPAIEVDKSLAREQAQLIVAHLQLMKRQLPQASTFDQLELEAAASLGHQLLILAEGEAALAGSGQALESAINVAEHIADRQEAMRSINGAIEGLIRGFRLHAAQTAIDSMTNVVLAHTREKALRNRIWFASNGFDSEQASLPDFNYLFSAKPGSLLPARPIEE